MLLGALFVFLLARTVAHPVILPVDDPVPPSSPILSTFVTLSDCIRDPTKIRSRWELIWNCLGTIFVCTYVAIHPNLPDRNASKREKMWQKVKTSFSALLAPELVIMWAMRQRFVASRIVKQHKGQVCWLSLFLNRADRVLTGYGWTMTHAFFVQMGGLMCEDGKEYKVVVIDDEGNVELGSKKVHGGVILPAISEDEIRDKSKGDFLSKVVVVMQTSWFVLQCITRRVQHLVLTELELVTLAFATLNIIIYFLWWNKPLNAECPIYFKKDGTRCSGPLKFSCSSLGESERYSGIWLRSGIGLVKGIWKRIKSDIGRRSLVMTVWKRLLKEPFMTLFVPLTDMMGFHLRDKHGQTCVAPYYGGPLSNAEGTLMILLSSLVGVLFGGIHLIGWNFQFPTSIEQDLWRISSIIVTVEPALLFVLFTLQWLHDLNYSGWFGTLVHHTGVTVLIVSMFVGPVIYTVARIALLVLPLFALRDLPPSAFRNVQWSAYLPHI
ncbi:hypothetical protein AX16_006063 [Volvariella volvacea WC 439]|nr:hypothetical protein AX16_006063 [Volvariella volvacea WC 439]